MRRAVWVAIISLFVAGVCEAQRGGFGRAGARGGFSGRGFAGGMARGGAFRGGSPGVTFRGGGFRGGGFRGGSFRGGSFRGGYGYRGGRSFRGGRGFHGGYGFRGFGHRGFIHHRRFSSIGFSFGIGALWGFSPWGWGWPYFGAGFYDWDYPYYGCCGYAAYPAYAYAPAPAYPPIIIVNGDDRAYAPPPRRTPEPEPERNETPPQASRPYQEPDYSIAFRDHRIVHAIAYWVIDGRLHYVTKDHAMHEVPLADVDRLFSEQINRDKGVDFRLPGPATGVAVPPATQQ